MKQIHIFLVFFLIASLAFSQTKEYPNTTAKDIMADCPYRIEPEADFIPILVVVKDGGINIADYDLEYVSIRYKGNEIFKKKYNKRITDQKYNMYEEGDWYDIIYLPKTAASFPMDEKFKLSIKFKENGEWYDPDGDTYDDIYTRLSSSSYPRLENWLTGDVHFHSHFTDNEYEWGGPMEMARESGLSIGMDFITITDHSLDMNNSKYHAMKQLCDSLNTENFTLIPGEEVSAKNKDGHYLHTLVYNQGRHLKGCEISAPGYKQEGYYITEIIQNHINDTSFIFIAHPEIGKFRWEVSGLGWNIDRGTTEDKDYLTEGLSGLQIWNTRRGLENWLGYLNIGLEKWKGLLCEGKKIYISGGSDAHGDFSYSRLLTQDSYPEYESDYPNACGRVRTCLYSLSQDKSEILNSLKNGRSFCTDGPLTPFCFIQGPDTTMIGDSSVFTDKEGKLRLRLVSTPEFGEFDSVILYQGNISPLDNGINDYYERPVSLVRQPIYTDTIEIPLNSYLIPGKPYYFRIHSNTNKTSFDITHRAYTNPIFITRAHTDSTDLTPTSFNDSVPSFKLNIKSPYWRDIHLTRYSNRSIQLKKELNSPETGEKVLSDDTYQDTIPPSSADSFHIVQETTNGWYNDSLLTFSWNGGEDPNDSLAYYIHGNDITGITSQFVANGDFEIFDTNSTTELYQIESSGCQIYRDSLNNQKLAAISPNSTITMKSFLASDSLCFFYLDCLNKTNSDTIRLGLYIDGYLKETIPVTANNDLPIITAPYDMKKGNHEIKWDIQSDFTMGIFYFNGSYLFPLHHTVMRHDSLEYFLKAYNENNILVSTFSLTSSDKKNTHTVTLSKDIPFLSINLSTYDMAGNQGDSTLTIPSIKIDITPPALDSFYVSIAENHEKSNDMEIRGFYYQDSLYSFTSLDTVLFHGVFSDKTSGISTDSVMVHFHNDSSSFRLNYDSVSQSYVFPMPASTQWPREEERSLDLYFTLSDSAGNQFQSEDYRFYYQIENSRPRLVSAYPEDSLLSINLNDTILFYSNISDLENDSLDFFWFLDSVLISRDSIYQFIPDSLTDTVFQVRMTVKDPYDSISHYWKVFFQPTPINESLKDGVKQEKITSLSPNPCQNLLKIKFLSGERRKTSLTITDLLGIQRKSHDFIIEQGENELHISVNDLPSGIYLLRINGKRESFTRKFTILR